MDAEEISLMSASLREVFAGDPAQVERLLAELGWDEVVAEDPAVATRLMFLEQGRALSGFSMLDSVVIPELAAALPAPVAAVLYPRPASGWEPSSDSQRISGLVLRRPAEGTSLVAPVRTADGTALAIVAAADLTLTPLRAIDADLQWFDVEATTPSDLHPGAAWPSAVAAAHRALAAELVGVAGEILRLGIEHTSSRHQFGAPIAAFQAVRHRLADAHVAIVAATELLDVSFDEGSDTAATIAKAYAGRAHSIASANTQQVSGAMGATMEYPLHRFISRGLVLDALLGGWERLESELGGDVLRTGETPMLVEV